MSPVKRFSPENARRKKTGGCAAIFLRWPQLACRCILWRSEILALRSLDFAVNIEGAAGAGKTKALRALARGFQAGGRLMVAIAPTESAVKALKKVGFQKRPDD
jgi:hypothetical protein